MQMNVNWDDYLLKQQRNDVSNQGKLLYFAKSYFQLISSMIQWGHHPKSFENHQMEIDKM